MKKLAVELINKCRKLRRRGRSLGEIACVTKLPKTTLYKYVKDILLTCDQVEDIKIRNKQANKNRINPRKGKCLPGREIIKPKLWSDNLVHIVAHFMFDGRVDNYGCIYYSKDRYQIDHMKKLVENTFKAKPEVKLRDNGVYGLTFYHVEFADFIKNNIDKLPAYLSNGASQRRKRLFLKAFFDDEGNVFYKNDKRRVRGYQKSHLILEYVKNLLLNFGIKGRIDETKTNIEISGRNNLVQFSKEINFSPEIYINPNRKNSIWKEKLSKRKILDLLLKSYRSKNKKRLDNVH